MTTTDTSRRLLDQRDDWLRRLARNLVRDAHAADDVAQEALLAAARTGRVDHGWLVGVVRTIAASHRRRDARRRQREECRARQATAAGHAPSAAGTAARVEQERLLAEAVLALDEPFRDVVLLRIYDGLPPRRIAGRLGIPVATVNSRWTRALAKLRRQLDAAHGGDSRAWLTALAPVVVAGGRRGSAALAAAGTSTALAALWMPKQASWAAAAVLLALAGWWAVSAPSGPHGGPPTAIDPLPATADADETTAPDSGAGGTAPAVRSEAPLAPRTATTADAPASDTVRVTVVDDATGAPVRDAEVVYVDASDPEFQRRWALARVRHGGSLEGDALFAVGGRVELEKDASFAIPRSSTGPRMWSARRGRTHGLLRLDPGSVASDHVLRLVRLREVEVEVLDADGAPAPGVPVGLFYRGERGGYVLCGLDRPGEDRHLATLRWDPSSPFVRGPLAVGLHYPGAPDPTPLANDGPPPGTRVRLHRPPVGSVEVAPTGPVVGGVLPIASISTVQVDEPQAAGDQGWETLVRDDGSVRFWPVGLGLGRLRIALPAAGRPVHLQVEGPTHAGETVWVEAPRRVVVAVRLVEGRDARPLAGMRCFLQVLPDDANRGFEATADAAGRIEVRLGPGQAGVQRILKVTLADTSRREATVELPEDELRAAAGSGGGRGREPATWPLGDLRFGRTAVLAEGRVVDAEGRPLARIRVDVGVGVDGGGRADGETRRLAWGFSGEDGRFEVLADPESVSPSGEPLWIRAIDASGAFGHEREALVRGEDVRLTMATRSVLRGRLLAGSAAPQLTVCASREDDRDTTTSTGEVAGDGRFVIPGLLPGTYTVSVRTANRTPGYWHTGPVVREIQGLEVGPGHPDAPAVLDGLDLRGTFRVVALDVRDREGRTLHPHAYACEAAEPAPFVGVADGPLVVPGALERLTLVLDGHEPLEVGIPPADTPEAEVSVRAVMASLRRVALSVHTGGFDLPPGQRLLVDLEPVDGAADALPMHAGMRPYPGSRPSPDGLVHVPVVAAGRHRLVARVATTVDIGAGYVPPVPLPAAVCPVLEIGPVARRTPHPVSLPADALRAASEALGRE